MIPNSKKADFKMTCFLSGTTFYCVARGQSRVARLGNWIFRYLTGLTMPTALWHHRIAHKNDRVIGFSDHGILPPDVWDVSRWCRRSLLSPQHCPLYACSLALEPRSIKQIQGWAPTQRSVASCAKGHNFNSTSSTARQLDRSCVKTS